MSTVKVKYYCDVLSLIFNATIVLDDKNIGTLCINVLSISINYKGYETSFVRNV